MRYDAPEYTSTAQREYTVKTVPCFRQPNRNSGVFSSRRNSDRVYRSGVICQSSMEVPEMPLSYRCTGAKNMVTPMALMIPAANSSAKEDQRSPSVRVWSFFFMGPLTFRFFHYTIFHRCVTRTRTLRSR